MICDWSSALGPRNNYYVKQNYTTIKTDPQAPKGYIEPQSKQDF